MKKKSYLERSGNFKSSPNVDNQQINLIFKNKSE